jgi:predicted DNA-binding transcriptional regulator AlpA
MSNRVLEIIGSARDAVNDSRAKTTDAEATVHLLYVDDIVALLGAKKSRWWIRNHFAPNAKLKIGRTVAWIQGDALAWLQTQRVSR